ncbi:glycosyltransferase family 4 protein [Rhizobium sp. 18055]|uniref:glycosyltransferase family 4 protein n=1 Tax=Rhizobium sp. 18055 TaxID=2681403 RepID=UPI00135CB254|nr:glycosyltransferase family 4 protein [Rhizobium sp. 18055]
MRLLFCSEFYFPSVGGVQEVMRQIAERLVQRGHEVTVVTTRLENRDFSEHNGVKIVEFGVSGNLVRGMEGEVESYRRFMTSFDCDAILIKAAQQWTFDALWPVLDEISPRKVLIPCGFSGLFEPSYAKYFDDLPDILKKFDHLIFYAEHYRDVDFARQHGIGPFSILANGASEIEFGSAQDPDFRRKHGIPEDSAVLLTVGSLTGVKGHKELLEAFVRLKTTRRHVTFIMNGNLPPKPMVVHTGGQSSDSSGGARSPLVVPAGLFQHIASRWDSIRRVYAARGVSGLKESVARRGRFGARLLSRCGRIAKRLPQVWIEEGWLGIRSRAAQRLGPRLERLGLLRYLPAHIQALTNPLSFWMAEAGRGSARKLLIVSDYPRDTLVQAYMAADLFVFASNIEYSPLVLFESAAAGTPFLTVPVGNAEEIARWTGAGIICPAEKDARGYTRVAPEVLSREIANAIESPERLLVLGQAGRAAWSERYTWAAISTRYEELLEGEQTRAGQGGPSCKPV